MTKHNAPAVVYPIGRPRPHFWLSWVLWCVGLLLTLLWFSSTRSIDWRLALGCASVMVSGWVLRQGWRNVTSGQLAWDGNCWRWEHMNEQTASSEQDLSVIADFQRFMVVVLNSGAGGRLWFWVDRNTFPARWLDFRRAVYSTRKTAPEPALIDHVAG